MKIEVPYSPAIVIGYPGIFLHQFLPIIFQKDGSEIKLDTSRNLHQAYKTAFKEFKKIMIANGDAQRMDETSDSVEDFAIGKMLQIMIEQLKSENNIIKIQSPMIESFHVNKSEVEYQANKKMIEYFEMLLKDVRSI